MVHVQESTSDAVRVKLSLVVFQGQGMSRVLTNASSKGGCLAPKHEADQRDHSSAAGNTCAKWSVEDIKVIKCKPQPSLHSSCAN